MAREAQDPESGPQDSARAFHYVNGNRDPRNKVFTPDENNRCFMH